MPAGEALDVAVVASLDQRVRVLRQAEEVVVFLDVLDLERGVQGAVSVDEVVFGLEALTPDAIETLVRAEIDLVAVVELLHEDLDRLLVTLFGGPDEVVVADVECGPDLFPTRQDLVGPLLRAHALALCRSQDLLAVLVGPGQEVNLPALEAPETDEEWTAIRDSAAIIAESGNLLLMPGRARDQGDLIGEAGMRHSGAAIGQGHSSLFENTGPRRDAARQ